MGDLEKIVGCSNVECALFGQCRWLELINLVFAMLCDCTHAVAYGK